jgi:PDZ domain-containing protein
VVGAVVVLLVVTFVILIRIPSDKYVLLVDPAHPVAPLVKVQGARPAKSGSLYFVDVKEERASELQALFPWLLPAHSSLVPAGAIVAPCSTAAQADAAAAQEMAFSQRVAAAVALRKLHYHVVVRPTGVVVSQLIGGLKTPHGFIPTHASCNLQPMDVVVAVDGMPTPTRTSLTAALERVDPGDVVKLRIHRAGKTLTVPIKTIDDGGRALVGFVPGQSATFKLPRQVTIDANGIGGPSAGLAFTLEVMQQLGRNVLHGHKVAATGEMELNGAVGPIGGIKQKTYGVRKAGADVFLVPAGKNAQDARKYAGPLRIIAVRSLDQALHELATLPPSS